MRFQFYVLSFAALQFASAEHVGYFESNDCAAPSDFASCYDDADSWWTDCINDNCKGQNIDCQNACECARQQSYTRCAASYCWNMVYSCEYQQQVTDSINSCIKPDVDSVPFWPAPDNAAGRCSCSIGDLTTVQFRVNQVIAECGDQVDPFSQSADDIQSYGMGCLCCGFSGLLSSLSSVCPRLDPAELGMDDMEQLLVENAVGVDWAECQEWLSQYDCAGDFGYPSSIETYYGPGEIPEGGTETLSNIGALTTPASATAVFTIGSQLFSITAVSTDAAVPTGSGKSDTDREDKDSDSSASSETTTSSQDGSDAEETGTDTPTDLAVPIAVSLPLSGVIAMVLGAVYLL
ncbi:hypothetical protein BDV18DRAFT_149815 [Aspergillus unguis]